MPVPQIIGFYIKRNLAAFLRPGSGVEETANAVQRLRREAGAERRRCVSQSRSGADLSHDCRGRTRCLLRRADCEDD